MQPNKFTTILAIFASLGMIIWLSSKFYGGMFIWLLSYPLLIFPVIILYIVSFINTIASISNKGIKQNRIKAISHGLVIMAMVGSYVYDSDLFKSRRVLTATMYDDLFSYTLILRENGLCENDVNGFMGFSENFKGTYHLKGDTIIFTKVPYDTENFIPDILLIDKKEGAVFIHRDSLGNFNRQKDFLNHFKIIDFE